MTKQDQPQASPERGAQHDALEGFLGDWKATGQSFGGPDQDARDPRRNPTPWTSTHNARWHTGEFFLIQDERAQVGGPFDTLSVMGWDDDAGCYFARAFENHGFYRHYDVTVEGKVWTISKDRTGAHRIQRRRQAADHQLGVAAEGRVAAVVRPRREEDVSYFAEELNRSEELPGGDTCLFDC